MRQTTQTGTHQTAGPLADAGPYDYDLPVARDAGPPAHAPRPARRAGGLSWMSVCAIAFVSIATQVLHDWSGLPRLHCQMILYCVAFIFMYWDTPRPKQGFLTWTLQVVGIFLNAFVALVTVPQSLRGLLPDSLAFSLPVFFVILIFYWVSPMIQSGRAGTLRTWLLCAAGFAAFWGWLGPTLIR